MKTLQVLEPEKLTPEEVKALRDIGFAVELTDADYERMWMADAKAFLESTFGPSSHDRA